MIQVLAEVARAVSRGSLHQLARLDSGWLIPPGMSNRIFFGGRKMGSLSPEKVAIVVETSEWFDWLRQDLLLGGLVLPNEESAVWMIQRALHLADRLRGTYRHLPESLREQFVRSQIVYQCWKEQRDRCERSGRLIRPALLSRVKATAYLKKLGTSGRHHLIEADDGFSYVVTVASGLWTEFVPATEILCCELARQMGLSVPVSAVVVLSPEHLRKAQESGSDWRRPEGRFTVQECCGFRYVETDEADTDIYKIALRSRALRTRLLGALLFNVWVGNRRTGRFALRDKGTVRGLQVVFFDYSECFWGSWWSEFTAKSEFADLCANVQLSGTDGEDLRRWARKIRKIDMNPFWELAFQIPHEWYGGNRVRLVDTLQVVEGRRYYLAGEINRIMNLQGSPPKRPCRAEQGCATSLACRLTRPALGSGAV